MAKYISLRIVKGILSAICVVVLIMVLVFSLMDRTTIFAGDPNYSKMQSNARLLYEQSRYQAFGYVDYTTYSDYIKAKVASGEIDDSTRAKAVKLGNTAEKDSEITASFVEQFTKEYEAQGYTIVRLDADKKTNGKLKDGGSPAIYATRDRPLLSRVVSYFTNLLFFDNIHHIPETTDIGARGLTFTLHDPFTAARNSPLPSSATAPSTNICFISTTSSPSFIRTL